MTHLPRRALALVLAATLAGAARAQSAAQPFAGRRDRALDRAGTALVIVPSRASFLADDQKGFVQAADFYYLTGLEDVMGAVLVLDGRDRSTHLFVARPLPLLNRGVVIAGAASAARLGLSHVAPVDSLEPWLRRRFAAAPTAAFVAPTDARMPAAAPLPMAASVTRWQAWLVPLGATAASSAIPVLRPLREVKEPGELVTLREVARTSGAGFLAGLRGLRPGRRQAAAELDVVQACHDAGARSVSFWPWTMSGPNADFHNLWDTFLSYDHVDRAMQAGEVVRVDVGCQVGHYMGDVGRTAPVGGRFTDGQREAWDLFIAGYQAGRAVIRDGVTARAVYDAALAEIRTRAPTLRTEQGKEAARVLLGPNGTEAWELHGVGLDDAEGLPDTLRAGMTVAYELMFVAKGDGFYLEDMIAVTPTGSELLTAGLPYTAAEIEAAMRGGHARRAGAKAPARR
ncbi:MAG: aminopeptidase P family protein [Gemmatimonadetes bacterium]|nr:aminopeptidase P family protein [Gemmatimonadota bacterium]